MTYFRKHVDIIFLIAFIILSSCISTKMFDEAIKKQESAMYHFTQKDFVKAKELGEEALGLWGKLKKVNIKSMGEPDWAIENFIERCENLIVSCTEMQWIPTAEVLEEPIMVPIQIVNNAILVKATLNSEERVTLLFDTGASKTILTPYVARNLGISPKKNAPKRTMSLIGGKTIKIPFVHISEIKIGDATVNNLMVGVSTIGLNISSLDGVLGSDFFKYFTVNIDREASQLKLASQNKSLMESKSYIDEEAGVESVAEHKPNPLMEAASMGDMDQVQALLAQGADVNAKFKNGYTALMFAALDGHTDIVKALLAQGADVNAKGSEGGTVLLIAARYGHSDTLKVLLSKDADISAKDNKGVTALMAAKKKGYKEIIHILKEAGAKE